MQWITWPLLLAALFIEALALSAFLTPWACRIGMRMKMMDEPGERKIHTETIPRSGGIAIFTAFFSVLALNLLLAFIISPLLEDKIPHVKNMASKLGELLALLIGAAWIFAVGIIDDRVMMRPRTKFFCQIIAVIPLLIAGIQLHAFLWNFTGMLATVFWVVLLMNSMNFLDNMDGLSAGVGTICAAIFAWIAFDSGQNFMAAMFILVAGSYSGFLCYNFHPAKIFMGDSGSMLLGYLLAALAIQTDYWQQGSPSELSVIMPVVVLGVPLFDTVSVLWIRWRSGKPLYRGDKNHFSHRLVALGMSQRKAVVFIYLVTCCVGLSALPFRSLSGAAAAVYSLQVILWFVIIYNLERLAQK